MGSTKKKKKFCSPKYYSVWLIFLVLFMAELFLYTWCRVQCVRIGYDIAQETRKQGQLRLLQKSLTIELARLKSPERIISIAETRLGLIMPNARQTIIMP